MTIKHATVTVATTATALNTAVTKDGTPSMTMSIQVPTGGATVYVGGAGVTTTAYGYAIAAGGVLTIEMGQDEVLFGVVAASTQAVYVLRQGVQ